MSDSVVNQIAEAIFAQMEQEPGGRSRWDAATEMAQVVVALPVFADALAAQEKLAGCREAARKDGDDA